MKVDKNLHDKWKEKIISDIGEEKYKQLFFSTNENINISPYYTDYKNTIINPDKLLFPDEWKIISEIDCNKCENLNNEIKKLFNNEIKSIIIYNYSGQPIDDSIKIKTNLYFKRDKLVRETSGIKVIVEPKLDTDSLFDLNTTCNDNFKLNISSEFFKNSGANIFQEIAFTVSAGIDYINKYGIRIIDKISFEVFQGGNYFFEIAKIQALRIIWSIVTKEYGKQIDNCIITAKPTSLNKTSENYNNNIVRTTSECMSGILGGCDFIKSIPYDLKFEEKNEFSQRITNNQLLILKNETSIDHVINAISGSFYITYLIDKLANKSLDLVKKIENNGGYLNDLKQKGFFKEILLNKIKDEAQYKSGKKILVGQNKYLND